MKAPALHQISFHIDETQKGELTAYFEQDGERYSRLVLLEINVTEYYVGDNPIPESISGHIGLHLIRKEFAQPKCPYEIKVHTNLVRNPATARVYEHADQLLDSLNSAIEMSKTCQMEITDDLETVGWYMTCN